MLNAGHYRQHFARSVYIGGELTLPPDANARDDNWFGATLLTCGIPSVIWTWLLIQPLVCVLSNFWTSPLGHLISTASILVALPRPKWIGRIPSEAKPEPASTCRSIVLPAMARRT